MNLTQNNNKNISRYSLVSDDQRAFQVSESKNFLIFDTNTTEVVKAAGAEVGTITIEHALGYEPMINVSYKLPANKYYASAPSSFTIGAAYLGTISAKVNKKDLVLTVEIYDPSGFLPNPLVTVFFKYFIFRESASRKRK